MNTCPRIPLPGRVPRQPCARRGSSGRFGFCFGFGLALMLFRSLRVHVSPYLLQQAVSRKKNKRSNNRRKAVALLSAESRRIANCRKDFLHQTSADLVKQYGLIATEQLNVKNMTAAGGEYKKGLNRSILDTAPSTFINLLKTKAEEAGSLWVEVPTRQAKPSQTCHRCGIQRKKLLSERKHQCDCGASCSRDENAARVMLNWALFGNATGQELSEVGSGCSLAAKRHETPPIAACAV